MALSSTVPVPSGVNEPSGTEEVVDSGVPEGLLPEFPVLPELLPWELVLPDVVPVWELPLWVPVPVLPEEAAWVCAGFATGVLLWLCCVAAAGFSVGAGSL